MLSKRSVNSTNLSGGKQTKEDYLDTLTVISDDGKKVKVALNFLLTPEIVIGRHSECHIMLKEMAVSRKQLKLVKENEKVIVVPLSTRIPIFVNDNEISEKIILKNNDIISVHNKKFKYQRKFTIKENSEKQKILDSNKIVIKQKMIKEVIKTPLQEKPNQNIQFDVPMKSMRTPSKTNKENEILKKTPVKSTLVFEDNEVIPTNKIIKTPSKASQLIKNAQDFQKTPIDIQRTKSLKMTTTPSKPARIYQEDEDISMPLVKTPSKPARIYKEPVEDKTPKRAPRQSNPTSCMKKTPAGSRSRRKSVSFNDVNSITEYQIYHEKSMNQYQQDDKYSSNDELFSNEYSTYPPRKTTLITEKFKEKVAKHKAEVAEVNNSNFIELACRYLISVVLLFLVLRFLNF
eukprot:gene11180-4000_t